MPIGIFNLSKTNFYQYVIHLCSFAECMYTTSRVFPLVNLCCQGWTACCSYLANALHLVVGKSYGCRRLIPLACLQLTLYSLVIGLCKKGKVFVLRQHDSRRDTARPVGREYVVHICAAFLIPLTKQNKAKNAKRLKTQCLFEIKVKDQNQCKKRNNAILAVASTLNIVFFPNAQELVRQVIQIADYKVQMVV